MNRSVYLAGPIGSCSYKGCTEWRDRVTADFRDVGITAYSPMRGKSFLQDEKRIDDREYTEPLATPPGIVARDRFDTLGCDVVLLNLLHATKASIGSMIEIGWADSKRTPIVLVMEYMGNPHTHPMVKDLCSFYVHRLGDGVDIVKRILLP
jgi:nucleoside 2-deoxyribosyltransferase